MIRKKSPVFVLEETDRQDPFRNLWIAVLKQGIRSALKRERHDLYWFYNEKKRVGSIVWICEQTRLDLQSIRRAVFLLMRSDEESETKRIELIKRLS